MAYFSYLYTDIIGFETLGSKVLSMFLFNLEQKTLFKKLLMYVKIQPLYVLHSRGNLARGFSFFKISSKCFMWMEDYLLANRNVLSVAHRGLIEF